MDKLANLISVKKIIALLLTFTFIYLSVVGKIDGESFMTVFLMIISFYYGQSTMKDAKDTKQNP